MNTPTQLSPTCTQVQDGVTIGWQCGIMTDMTFSWQYSTDNGATWLPMPDTSPQITVTPAETTMYRLCRSFTNNPDYPVVVNPANCADACIDITVVYPTIDSPVYTPSDLLCCLHAAVFTLAPGNPLAIPYDPAQPNRTGFVAASGTWTSAANPFITAGLAAPGDDIILDVDLVVPSGVTLELTNDIVLRFAPNRRVLVQQNSKLSISGTTTLLTGICSAVWQGIQVQGPPQTARMVDAFGVKNYGICEIAGQQPAIENAIIGIAGMEIPLMDVATIAGNLITIGNIFMPNSNGWAPTIKSVLLNSYTNSLLAQQTAGGVVRVLKRPLFQDCLVGVNLSWYDNNLCSPASVIPCDQSVVYTADFFSTAMVYPFNTLSITVNTEAGVELVRYQNLIIGDNTGSSNYNHFLNNKYGIRGIDADGLTIRGNDFEHCRSGVSVSNGMLNPFSAGSNISNNNFSDCTISIQGGFAYLYITENTINATPPPSPNPLGIFLMGSSFIVEDNPVIDHVRVGTALLSNDADNNFVRNNTFSNNSLCVGLYGNNTGTNVVCNNFNQYQIWSVYSGNYVSTDPTYPSESGLLGDQGKCDPFEPYPADNTFNGAPASTFEILSLNAANFNYFYRPVAPFIPTDTWNNGITVTPIACAIASSVEDNILCMRGRSERSDAEIIAEPDENTRNREAKITADYYVREQGDTAAAINLLSAINTDMGRRLLIPQYLQTAQYEQAQALINTLPDAQLEESNYKQMSQIYQNIAQNGQGITSLNATDETAVRQIAQSYTKSSFAARNLLLLLYGEEYAITLPSLDSLSNVAIAFKNGATKANYTDRLYPNPAQGLLQYNATHLLPTDRVSINLFTPQGQCVKQYSAVGGTPLKIDTDSLLSGIYYYHILVNGQHMLTDKIVLIK